MIYNIEGLHKVLVRYGVETGHPREKLRKEGKGEDKPVGYSIPQFSLSIDGSRFQKV